MNEWKKPPPKLVRKKEKFPIRLLLKIALIVFFVGALVTWLLFGSIMPIDVILIIWSFLTFFIFFSVFAFLLVITKYKEKGDFNL